MPDDDDTDTIIICAGPPLCGLEGYDAIMCQLEGCTICRRIVVDRSKSDPRNIEVRMAFPFGGRR